MSVRYIAACFALMFSFIPDPSHATIDIETYDKYRSDMPKILRMYVLGAGSGIYYSQVWSDSGKTDICFPENFNSPEDFVKILNSFIDQDIEAAREHLDIGSALYLALEQRFPCS